MAPTPLKIKGKGPRKQTWAPPDPNKLKRARSLQEEAMRESRKLARRRRPALIEQLPTEILERIFFLSENLNFPRSSLRIGRTFSHPSALVQLTVAAFSPTWKLGLGCNEFCGKSQALFREGCRENKGSPALESAVLACPWMTVAILDQAQQVFQRRDRSFELRHGGNDPESACQSARESNRACEDLDTDLGLLLKKRKDKDPDCVPPRFAFRHWREIHPSTLIPDHLYTGPFGDWEKVKLLFWMIRTGAFFPEGHSRPQPWELTMRGFKHIISLEDDPAKANLLLQLFLKARVFDAWPREARFEPEEYVVLSGHNPALSDYLATLPGHIDRDLMRHIFVYPGSVRSFLERCLPSMRSYWG